MPIPTQADYDLAEIEEAGATVQTLLRTMRHANVRDLPRMRERLRDTLQSYVDLCMAMADGAAP